MIIGDTTGDACARISFLDAVWAANTARTMRRSSRPSVLGGRPELGLRVWECSTDYC